MSAVLDRMRRNGTKPEWWRNPKPPMALSPIQERRRIGIERLRANLGRVSLSALARLMDVEYTTVRNWARMAGMWTPAVPTGKKKPPARGQGADVERMIRLAGAGSRRGRYGN